MKLACSVFGIALSLFGNVEAASVSELVEKGDYFDRKFAGAEALKFYLPAESQEGDNVIILVKISRQYRYLMSDAPGSSEKIRLGKQALGYAERAAALDASNADAQLALAITKGRLLPLLGKKEQVEYSWQIKESAQKAIRLDSSNDLGWQVLGRWHKNRSDVSGAKEALGEMLYGKLPPGSNEEAVKCFLKAISLNPSRPMHYIELGRTYAQMGKVTEAREMINKGLDLPNMDKEDPELKKRGKETLSNLKN